ncbi:MAG: hypothetical protein KIT09_34710 [Bryobacteraceae bacterium]|nr:hypothetical protein [Bryobacteraceae bacterium]
MRKFSFALIAAICFSAAGLPRLEAAPWKRLESANFEMFTTTGEGRARQLLDHFERVRQFFLQSSGRQTISSLPVRIIVLDSRKEWEKYRVSESAAAFFHPGLTRDFIVMSGETEEILRTATHEFTHLIVRHSGAELPIWLNEGLAELYSTLRPDGNGVRLGEVIQGRAFALARDKWLTMPELAAVDHASAHYTEKERAGVFYAESWLLTHMLYLSEKLRPKAAAFVGAVGGGQTTEEAFQSVYGLTLAQVDWELHDYYEGGRVYTAVLPIQLQKIRGKAEAVPATPVQQAMCEGLLLAFVKKNAEAMTLLERLAGENPGDVDVAEAATEAAWQSREFDKGAAHAERALTLGSRNQALRWRYAEHLAARDLKGGRLVQLLRATLEDEPSNLEARLLLIDALAAREEYAAAIEEARPVRKVEPKQATRFFAALAMARWMTNDRDQARDDLRRAIQYARQPERQRQCDAIGEYFDRQEELEQAAAQVVRVPPAGQAPPAQPAETARPKRVATLIASDDGLPVRSGEWERRAVAGGAKLQVAAGALAALQCSGGGATVLIVREAGGSYLRLVVDDPKKVLLEGAGTDSFVFTCGAQKPLAVEVEYVRDSAVNEAGVLRVLRFVREPPS